MTRPILSFALLAALLCTSACDTAPTADESFAAQQAPRTAEDEAFANGTDRRPSARTLHRMGRLLAAQHNNEEAEAVLERCIERYPQFAPAYCELAELHTRTGQIERAVDVLEDGRNAVPNDAAMANNLGVCHLLDADYHAALTLFDEATELDPDNARYQANRATALGMLGKYDETLQTYLAILPEAEAHYNLAILYQASREHEEARRHFRRAEALGFNPENTTNLDSASR